MTVTPDHEARPAAMRQGSVGQEASGTRVARTGTEPGAHPMGARQQRRPAVAANSPSVGVDDHAFRVSLTFSKRCGRVRLFGVADW